MFSALLITLLATSSPSSHFPEPADFMQQFDSNFSQEVQQTFQVSLSAVAIGFAVSALMK